jgi:transcriptional regulator with XRE-family HTH domain
MWQPLSYNIGMSKPVEPLAATLQRLRQQAGLSLRDLEARSGVDRGFISRLENGTRSRAGAPTLNRLAEALGDDRDALLKAAGYTTVAKPPLPTLTTYLRSKYSHLPAEARQDVAAYIDRLEAEYGSKPKAKPEQSVRKKNT